MKIIQFASISLIITLTNCSPLSKSVNNPVPKVDNVAAQFTLEPKMKKNVGFEHTLKPVMGKNLGIQHTLEPVMWKNLEHQHTLEPKIRKNVGFQHTLEPIMGKNLEIQHTLEPVMGKNVAFQLTLKPIMGKNLGHQHTLEPKMRKNVGFEHTLKPVMGKNLGFQHTLEPVMGKNVGLQHTLEPIIKKVYHIDVHKALSPYLHVLRSMRMKTTLGRCLQSILDAIFGTLPAEGSFPIPMPTISMESTTSPSSQARKHHKLPESGLDGSLPEVPPPCPEEAMKELNAVILAFLALFTGDHGSVTKVP